MDNSLTEWYWVGETSGGRWPDKEQYRPCKKLVFSVPGEERELVILVPAGSTLIREVENDKAD